MPDSPLRQKIVRLIEATGPISLAQYMHMCMADPLHGYYASRTAIGAGGDFITSPQVSQMFGELVGIWCAAAWQAIGSPARFVLAEAGSGLGTMMHDLLRAAATVPGFREAAMVRLIETSPAMIAAQRAKLADLPFDIGWTQRLETLEDGPLVLVANEFLDVLPVRQFVRAGGIWRERCIGLSADGALASVLGPALADISLLPAGHESEPDGSVFEYAPAREAWIETLAVRLAEGGGTALLIDYGHSQSGFGDTFQAMRAHAPADPLADPGLADMTSHVDFAAIANAARSGGAWVSPVMTQGDFLLAMGIAERAGALGSGQPSFEQENIRAAAERLVLPGEMGDLFKVIALCSKRNASAMNGLPPYPVAPSSVGAPSGN
ncbi:MAG TPA: class I SAM-dependent methyltransferase [Rhizobiaceae bacterium]|nr:class I SAM-dependent methyltransferase [Rhizobiaceae bacterium]